MLLLFWGIVLLLLLFRGGLCCCCSGSCVVCNDLEQLTEHSQYSSENFVQLLYVLLYSGAVSMATDLTYSKVLLVGAPSRGNPSH